MPLAERPDGGLRRPARTLEEIAGARPSDHYRLVAENARGRYDSIDLRLVTKPKLSLSARRDRDALFVRGKVMGWARPQIAGAAARRRGDVS